MRGFLLSFIFCALVVTSYANPIESYQKAQDFYKTHEYKKALDFANKSIEENPNYADAYLLIAQINYDMNNYDMAQEFLDKAQKYKPSFFHYLVLQANNYHYLGEYQKSENLFKQLFENYPASGELYFYYSLLLLDEESYTDFLLVNEKALGYEDFIYRNQFVKGKYYEKIGDNAKAKDIYEDILLQFSDNIYVVYALSSLYHQENQDAKAKELLDSVNYLYDTYPQIYELYGNVETMLGNFESACEKYDQMLNSQLYLTDKQKAILYMKEAFLLFQMEPEKGLELMIEALDRDSNNEFFVLLGEQALVEYFDLEHPYRNKFAKKRYQKALAERDLGKVNSYIFNMRRALFVDPFYIDALQDLVDFYNKNGQHHAALKELKRYFLLNPLQVVKKKIDYYERKVNVGEYLDDSERYHHLKATLYVETKNKLWNGLFKNLFSIFLQSYSNIEIDATSNSFDDAMDLVQEGEDNFLIYIKPQADFTIQIELYNQREEVIFKTQVSQDLSHIEEKLYLSLLSLFDYFPQIGAIEDIDLDRKVVFSVPQAFLAENKSLVDQEVYVIDFDKNTINILAKGIVKSEKDFKFNLEITDLYNKDILSLKNKNVVLVSDLDDQSKMLDHLFQIEERK